MSRHAVPLRERAIYELKRRAVLLHAEWPAPVGVHACTTLRRAHDIGASAPPFDRFNLGERCGDDASAVCANRAALRTIANLPVEPCWLHQVHGTRVLTLDAGREVDSQRGGPSDGDERTADAVVTFACDTVLAILSADCLPVLFCSEDGTAIGAAHAGWRGLAAGVLEATVAAMQRPSHRLLAWLGPAAGPQAYEVGEEVRAAFVDRAADAASAFVPTRPGHWHADLFALARQRLAAIGIERVSGGGLCTISDPARFFSHRRDARSGRMATLIWRTCTSS